MIFKIQFFGTFFLCLRKMHGNHFSYRWTPTLFHLHTVYQILTAEGVYTGDFILEWEA